MRGVAVVDLDDTLIPDVAAARAAIATTLTCLEVKDATDAVDTVLACARSAWRVNPDRDHAEFLRVSSWEALWMDIPASGSTMQLAAAHLDHRIKVWQRALAELGGAENRAAEADRIFPDARAGLVRPFPGAVSRLEQLSQGHALWLATDGGRLQRRKLQLSGLARWFSRVFVSAEVGQPKGTPEFAAALQAAVVSDMAEVCVLIGDSVSSDVQLATVGGWPAVHVCGTVPCSAESAEYPVPVKHCPAFADLVLPDCRHR